MLFKQFFNQKVIASTFHLFVVFFVYFGQLGVIYDSKVTNRRSVGEGGLSQGVLSVSYWSPWSHI
jgi:hypothetical protein